MSNETLNIVSGIPSVDTIINQNNLYFLGRIITPPKIPCNEEKTCLLIWAFITICELVDLHNDYPEIQKLLHNFI